jgi:hypothetical protein
LECDESDQITEDETGMEYSTNGTDDRIRKFEGKRRIGTLRFLEGKYHDASKVNNGSRLDSSGSGQKVKMG